MTWVRLDDGFFDNPKVVRAGRAARDLYLQGLVWAGRNLTDGLIPAVQVPRFDAPTPQRLARQLVEVGLWEPVDVGWRIIDYLGCSTGHVDVDPARREWDLLRRWLAPQVFERDAWRCQYCGAENDLTVDHVQPLARGGTSDLENLLTACRPCSSAKSARLPGEWRR